MREISCVHVSFVVIGSWALAPAAAIKPSSAAAMLLRTRLAIRFLVGEKLLHIHFGVKRHVEKADHHFFPALIAVAHFLAGIGIVGVIGRVVEVRRAVILVPLGSTIGFTG